jgi:L-lactate permease
MGSKEVLAVVATVAVIMALVLSYIFVVNHWEDIKELATIAIVLGGSFAIGFGGFKLRARGK